MSNVDTILNWANAQVGKTSFYKKSIGTYVNSWRQCQAFVATAYNQVFGYDSKPTAADACKAWKIAGTENDLKPPAGAAVYFKSSSSAGHVGISTGDGYFINAGGKTIKKEKLTKSSYSGYRGWGWNGNHKLSGTWGGASFNTTILPSKTVQAEYTGYCACSKCCYPYSGGITASGEKLDPKKRTCAAPKSLMGKYIKVVGTGTSMDGKVFKCNDTGGAIKINNGVYRFDLYFPEHKDALTFGRRKGNGVKALIYDSNPEVAGGGGGSTSHSNETSEPQRVVQNITVNTNNLNLHSETTNNVTIQDGATLAIVHNNQLQVPPLKSGVTWETEIKGSPSKLTFTVLKSNGLNFQEGDAVLFQWNGYKIFLGYVFSKQRTKNGEIKVTAYDQLRYFKNKHTYVWDNANLENALKTICKDFGLKYKGYSALYDLVARNQEEKIKMYDFYKTSANHPKTISFKSFALTADKETLFDVINKCLNQEAIYKNALYIVYDCYGQICYSTPHEMMVNNWVNLNTAEDFDYTSSIDEGTYNRVIVTWTGDDGKEQNSQFIDVMGKNYPTSSDRVGVLQYIEDLGNIKSNTALGSTPQEVCRNLAKHLSKKTRKVQIKGFIGEPYIRAGCMLPVYLNFGDTLFLSWMVVDKVKHTFDDKQHKMDLTLLGGGEFVS